MRYNPFIERPEHYNEGGGGDILKGLLGVATGGLSLALDSMLGGSDKKPAEPMAPDKPTGERVAEKSGASFDEEAASKTSARQTARKGTSKFVIPLANATTGTVASGGTGLKI